MDKAYFPLFVDLSDKKILVVGAGNIGTRRISTLADFTGGITVVAREPSDEVTALADEGRLELKKRDFKLEDLQGRDMVIAATDNTELNRSIAEECRKQGIKVNVISDKSLCDFHFPGIVKEGSLVVGINAAGTNHSRVKRTRMEIETLIRKDNKSIVLGSRESKLAVIQTQMVMDYIRENCPEFDVSMLTMKTTGDKILDKTLDKIGGKGLFVKELDKALVDKRSDLSVHSLKDMPMEVPEELPLVAFSKREDPRDVLVLPEGQDEIDFSKPIGCSSLRRMLQFKKLYPKAEFKTIRGNVQTRLKKLDDGEYSAIILAAAGLKRLDLDYRVSRYFNADEMIPSAGQGILAVQGRKNEDYSFLEGYSDKDAADCAKAERAFVAFLDGGCSSPIAAFAEVDGDEMKLRGLYYSEEKKEYITGNKTGSRQEAEALGQMLAAELRERMEG